MTETRIYISDICTAHKARAIGSKIKEWGDFYPVLQSAIDNYSEANDRVPGQHFIVMPQAKHLVSAGDGRKTKNPDDYVIRTHREGPKMYLKRAKAGETNFLACVVYTLEAYLADPDITDDERKRISCGVPPTHVLVAVIASSGPESPVTPYRFVHNLAGGNKEYQCPHWDYHSQDCSEVIDILDNHIEFLEDKARAVIEHWNEWSVVAD